MRSTRHSQFRVQGYDKKEILFHFSFPDVKSGIAMFILMAGVMGRTGKTCFAFRQDFSTHCKKKKKKDILQIPTKFREKYKSHPATPDESGEVIKKKKKKSTKHRRHKASDISMSFICYNANI